MCTTKNVFIGYTNCYFLVGYDFAFCFYLNRVFNWHLLFLSVYRCFSSSSFCFCLGHRSFLRDQFISLNQHWTIFHQRFSRSVTQRAAFIFDHLDRNKWRWQKVEYLTFQLSGRSLRWCWWWKWRAPKVNPFDFSDWCTFQ